MEHYQEIMERVRCVVEEKIWATMTPVYSDSGVDITLYCSEYDFTFAKHVYYRDIELDSRPVLYIANMLINEFEKELCSNIERQ